jgi:ABC-type polar amino acid transport system ATPase subunit
MNHNSTGRGRATWPGAEVPAIELKDVRKVFGGNEVLRGVSTRVSRGETVCLIGASGSGKSTLLRCVNLLSPPTSGTIRFNGQTITDPHVDLNSVRSRMGMVFQHFNLFQHKTALDNITIGLRRVHKMPRAEAEERAMAQLDKVGLRSHASSRPANLSGGQQQRVAIARSLAMEPDVMLFDEATSALDPELVKGVLDIMRDLASTSGMTLMVVTHEMNFAREAADRILFIDRGTIAEDGPARTLLSDPQTPRLRSFLSQVL